MELSSPEKTFRNMTVGLCHKVKSRLYTFMVKRSESMAMQVRGFSPSAEIVFSLKFSNSLNLERISQQGTSLLFQNLLEVWTQTLLLFILGTDRWVPQPGRHYFFCSFSRYQRGDTSHLDWSSNYECPWAPKSVWSHLLTLARQRHTSTFLHIIFSGIFSALVDYWPRKTPSGRKMSSEK